MAQNNHSGAGTSIGAVLCEQGNLSFFEGRNIVEVVVKNCGDRPIQVGSHFHFFEVNKALEFDRRKAYGFRLAIPAGTAVRFEPGQIHEVSLVELGGSREVYGFNALVNGRLDDKKIREQAFALAKQQNFRGIS